MFSRHLLRTMLSVAAVLLGGAAARADVVIVNGGFETPAIGLVPGYLDILPGEEAMKGFTGWTVLSNIAPGFTQEGVDVVRAGTIYGSAGYEGNQYLDLDGFQPGGVFQNFGTVGGTPYTLSFGYANNPSFGATLPTATAVLEVFDTATLITLLSLNLSHSGSTAADLMWTSSGTLSFNALGANTTILFRSTDPMASVGGIFIDGVTVEGLPPVPGPSATPEPASFALALVGVASLGAWARRRSRSRLRT